MLFGLEILEIIFCIFVIGVGGFLRGFLGFGAALVIVPSLSIVLPPVFAIGILVIIEIPTIMYLVLFDFVNFPNTKIDAKAVIVNRKNGIDSILFRLCFKNTLLYP